jgi:hypothetical protein
MMITSQPVNTQNLMQDNKTFRCPRNGVMETRLNKLSPNSKKKVEQIILRIASRKGPVEFFGPPLKCTKCKFQSTKSESIHYFDENLCVICKSYYQSYDFM